LGEITIVTNKLPNGTIVIWVAKYRGETIIQKGEIVSVFTRYGIPRYRIVPWWRIQHSHQGWQFLEHQKKGIHREVETDKVEICTPTLEKSIVAKTTGITLAKFIEKPNIWMGESTSTLAPKYQFFRPTKDRPLKEQWQSLKGSPYTRLTEMAKELEVSAFAVADALKREGVIIPPVVLNRIINNT
jgi:hypothetical protein